MGIETASESIEIFTDTFIPTFPPEVLGAFYHANYPSVKSALLNILLVTASYIICFVPYHAVRIPYTLSQTEVISDCSTRIALFKAKEATLLLAVSNLCFDPILYYHLSKAFRLKVTETFASPQKTKAREEKPRRENDMQSTGSAC